MWIVEFGAVEFDSALGDESAGFRVTGESFGFLNQFGDGKGGGGGAKGVHLGRGEIFFRKFGFEVGSG